jgi:hypothetical protein
MNEAPVNITSARQVGPVQVYASVAGVLFLPYLIRDFFRRAARKGFSEQFDKLQAGLCREAGSHQAAAGTRVTHNSTRENIE